MERSLACDTHRHVFILSVWWLKKKTVLTGSKFPGPDLLVILTSPVVSQCEITQLTLLLVSVCVESGEGGREPFLSVSGSFSSRTNGLIMNVSSVPESPQKRTGSSPDYEVRMVFI